MIADFVTTTGIALASRALTAVVGVFVAVLAYRGYRRNGSRPMPFVTLGFAVITGVPALVLEHYTDGVADLTDFEVWSDFDRAAL